MIKKIVITGGLGYLGTELCRLYSGISRVNKIMTNTLNLNFYFDQLNEVMKITKQKDVLIVTKELQNECFMTINYPQELNNKIMKQLDKITGLRYH